MAGGFDGRNERDGPEYPVQHHAAACHIEYGRGIDWKAADLL